MGIYVLLQPGTEEQGDAIREEIRSQYDLLQVTLLDANVPQTWGEACWDDVLIVVFSSRDWPSQGSETIRAYRAAHMTRDENDIDQPGGFVLPLSVNPGVNRPPDPISHLKSLPYDDLAPGANGRMTRTIGAFLGLCLQPRDHRIFVSYRSQDGSEIARDLYNRLQSAGFRPWLDVAEEGNLPPGSDVQQRIRQQLSTAALVLLIDTPAAPASEWIRYEIDHANADLIPILPVVAGPPDVSRFQSLRALQRRVPIKPDGVCNAPLKEEEWERVTEQLEQLLEESYRRRLLVPSRTKEAFEKNQFRWQTLDARKQIFRTERDFDTMGLKILAISSFFDPQYLPAIDTFRDYVTSYPGNPEINYRLFVYDRDQVLSNAEIRELRRTTGDFCLFAHHSELPYLIPRICPR